MKTIDQQTLWIEEARRLHQPTPVKQNHVPQWLWRRLLKVFRDNPTLKARLMRDSCRVGYYMVRELADDVSGGFMSSSWLDHWGTTVMHGEQVFVAEPYLNAGDLENARRFADVLDLDFRIDANSWWYPGRTTRLIFRQRKGQP